MSLKTGWPNWIGRLRSWKINNINEEQANQIIGRAHNFVTIVANVIQNETNYIAGLQTNFKFLKMLRSLIWSLEQSLCQIEPPWHKNVKNIDVENAELIRAKYFSAIYECSKNIDDCIDSVAGSIWITPPSYECRYQYERSVDTTFRIIETFIFVSEKLKSALDQNANTENNYLMISPIGSDPRELIRDIDKFPMSVHKTPKDILELVKLHLVIHSFNYTVNIQKENLDRIFDEALLQLNEVSKNFPEDIILISRNALNNLKEISTTDIDMAYKIHTVLNNWIISSYVSSNIPLSPGESQNNSFYKIFTYRDNILKFGLSKKIEGKTKSHYIIDVIRSIIKDLGEPKVQQAYMPMLNRLNISNSDVLEYINKLRS